MPSKYLRIVVFFLVFLFVSGVQNSYAGRRGRRLPPHIYVKVENKEILVDYDRDNIYQPFFVKGVGYAPTPVGHFIARDWWGTADCFYSGPYPFTEPTLRFERAPISPDAVNGFTCGPAGVSDFYQSRYVFDRDFAILQAMNANTIRTWGNVNSVLLNRANLKGIKVIAGFWVDHGLDYTFDFPGGSDQKQAIIDDFVSYVNLFKKHKAILMWGLSNENNMNFCNPCITYPSGDCDEVAQATGYYQLMNDMALAAKAAEAGWAHPVIVVSAELDDNLKTYGHLMPDVDLIGINSYRGISFDGYPVANPNLFEDFEAHFPNKGMVITEFGVDAYNSNAGSEDQDSQSEYDLALWGEIVANSVTNGGPCSGGVVFNYADEHNGYGQAPAATLPGELECAWVSSDWTPSVRSHDTEHTDPAVMGGGFPDGKVSPEWWGILSVAPYNGTTCNRTDQLDCMTPRQVYFDFQAAW